MDEIKPRELAHHALRLASHRSRRGRPVATWLRRSTSASYYAVFHALAVAVTSQIAPPRPGAERRRLTRSLEHNKAADVCAWLDGRGDGKSNVSPIVRRLRANRDLVRFAKIFVRLQQARHVADYDHLAVVEADDVLAHHREAAEALDLLEALRRTPDGQEFLALVALHTSLR